MSDPHKLESGDEIRAFVLAGNARFTIRSERTGTRYTYRIRTSDDERVYFVEVLTGTDNTNHFRYFGHIVNATLEFKVSGQHAKKIASAPSVKAFQWWWKFVRVCLEPPHCETWHEGRCGRCGRALTVPESIAAGIGPDCAGKMRARTALALSSESTSEVGEKR